MPFRENRVLITPAEQTVSALETNRDDSTMGWWVVSSQVEGFQYGINIEPPRVGISAKIGGKYRKEFYFDCDQTISVLATDVTVACRTRDLPATLVVAAIPVPSPGNGTVYLTDLGVRLGPEDVHFWDIPPCCVDVILTRGDPNVGAVLTLGVGGPPFDFYSVVSDGVQTITPKGATFVIVYNGGAFTLNYALRWTIRP